MPNKTFKAVAPTLTEEQLVEVKTALDTASTKDDVIEVVQRYGGKVGYGNLCHLLCGYEVTIQDGKLGLARPEAIAAKNEMDEFEAMFAQLLANKVEKPKVVVEAQ